MKITVDSRIKNAHLEIAAILRKYEVEWCADEDCEIWLDTIKPELRIVDADNRVHSIKTDNEI